jgi:hypothetical protein
MNMHINDVTHGVKFKDIAEGTIFTDDYDDIAEGCMSQIQMKMIPIPINTSVTTYNTVYLEDGSHNYYADNTIVYPINATLEIQGV